MQRAGCERADGLEVRLSAVASQDVKVAWKCPAPLGCRTRVALSGAVCRVEQGAKEPAVGQAGALGRKKVARSATLDFAPPNIFHPSCLRLDIIAAAHHNPTACYRPLRKHAQPQRGVIIKTSTSLLSRAWPFLASLPAQFSTVSPNSPESPACRPLPSNPSPTASLVCGNLCSMAVVCALLVTDLVSMRLQLSTSPLA